MKRGDVVLLDYPFADGSGSKLRPALVVQNDRDNQRLTNTIAALITKNVTRVHEPTQLLVNLSTPEGRQSGLNQTSAVTWGNLFAVAQTKIRRVIGSLSTTTMTRIDACLRAAFEMPSVSSGPTWLRRVGQFRRLASSAASSLVSIFRDASPRPSDSRKSRDQ